jgi:hypothetical protein
MSNPVPRKLPSVKEINPIQPQRNLHQRNTKVTIKPLAASASKSPPKKTLHPSPDALTPFASHASRNGPTGKTPAPCASLDFIRLKRCMGKAVRRMLPIGIRGVIWVL